MSGGDQNGQRGIRPVQAGPGHPSGLRPRLRRIGVGRERRADPHGIDPTGRGTGFAPRVRSARTSGAGVLECTPRGLELTAASQLGEERNDRVPTGLGPGPNLRSRPEPPRAWRPCPSRRAWRSPRDLGQSGAARRSGAPLRLLGGGAEDARSMQFPGMDGGCRGKARDALALKQHALWTRGASQALIGCGVRAYAADSP